MAPDIQNDGETLCREILADAHATADSLILQARQDAESLLANTTVTEETEARNRMNSALEEAARSRERILASIPAEESRLRAARTEQLLNSIHDDVLQRLLAHTGFDYQEAIAASAANAINRMSGSAFTVALSPEDHRTMGETLVADITRRTTKTGIHIQLVDDPAITQGGAIIRDPEGRQEWDNRLPARLERLWPALRLHLAASLFGDSSDNLDKP